LKFYLTGQFVLLVGQIKIACQFRPENDNSWPWEDHSGRKTTSHLYIQSMNEARKSNQKWKEKSRTVITIICNGQDSIFHFSN